VHSAHKAVDRNCDRSTVDHGHGRAVRSPALSAWLLRVIGVHCGTMERKRDPMGPSPRVANSQGATGCSRQRRCEGGGDYLSMTR
jgi:hypothetical protein